MEEGGTSPLPTKSSDEFKPFVRRLPEFKFWHAATRAVGLAFCCCWSQVFNLPVFWPVLVVYWFILVVLTMRRQIQHMLSEWRLSADVNVDWIADSHGCRVQIRSVGLRKAAIQGQQVMRTSQGSSDGAPFTGMLRGMYVLR